ncbi:hypothetical protein J0X20_26475 [Streptomyces sp. KCTC 0041BP]|uniref:hypothetical protein n=1 Tax=Streptomyces sp. KCTC 0041BP TaxID=201500 RepID=UPI001AE7593B|nr:hypothetical protein [Streptomyces sp. KCTC 0041BP]MBP0937133.1 hypothetical protein [Streptomyces sp. KCTC 0041BP]
MATAWQYLAGAGLVAALCPLQAQVAVAGEGYGDAAGGITGGVAFAGGGAFAGAARPGTAPADACVPTPPPAPVPPPAPSVRPAGPPPPARPPVRVTVPAAERPTVHHPGRAAVPARPRDAKAPAPEAEPRAEAAEVTAPPAPAVAGVARFHVRPYHATALERRGPGGLSTVMLMTVVTTPAVLAAAALRPRGKSRR